MFDGVVGIKALSVGKRLGTDETGKISPSTYHHDLHSQHQSSYDHEKDSWIKFLMFFTGGYEYLAIFEDSIARNRKENITNMLFCFLRGSQLFGRVDSLLKRGTGFWICLTFSKNRSTFKNRAPFQKMSPLKKRDPQNIKKIGSP